jgi:hypothetical protein
MGNARQNRAQKSSAAGGSDSYNASDYVQALNYYVNTFLNKEPTPGQREAVNRLNAKDVKRAQADASKEVRASESGSTNSSTPPKPSPRPERAPKLTDSGRVNAPPRPRSEREGKELASNAAERRAGSGSSRPSTIDTRSKKPIAKRIMEALGDKRTMEQATKDREMNQEMERETMGRKKGGMAKKKKAPVKKAYGGMVKKKQGGSANKVNMKAGFTQRGCSKG